MYICVSLKSTVLNHLKTFLHLQRMPKLPYKIYFNSFLKSIIQTKCYYWSEINIPAIQLRKYSEVVNAPFNTGMLSHFSEVSKCTVKLGHVRFYTRHSFHFNAISLVHWYKPARS